MDPIAVLEARYGDPQGVADELRRFDQRVVSLDTSLKLVGASPGDREAFLQFIPWAEALGVRWLRVFDGGGISSTLDVETLNDLRSSLNWWQCLRAEQGWSVDIMIETHDCLCYPQTIAQLFESVPVAPALLWDSHHTWKHSGEDPVQTWEAFKRHIVHIHVKDSISEPSANHPHTYVLPGEGEFPLGPLIERLEGETVSIPVSLEWEKAWHPYLPALDSALQALVAHEWLEL